MVASCHLSGSFVIITNNKSFLVCIALENTKIYMKRYKEKDIFRRLLLNVLIYFQEKRISNT